MVNHVFGAPQNDFPVQAVPLDTPGFNSGTHVRVKAAYSQCEATQPAQNECDKRVRCVGRTIDVPQHCAQTAEQQKQPAAAC